MADDRLLALVDGYAARKESLVENTQSQILSLWARMDPYDGKSVQQYVEQAAMMSAAAQAQMVYTTAAHQLSVMSMLDVEIDYTPTVPDEVRLFSDTEKYEYAKPVRRRTDLGASQRLPNDEVFNRVVRKYRYLRSVGEEDSKALDTTNERARLYIETNVLLAEREAEAQLLSFAEAKSKRNGSKKPRITGYRRVIHPERSRGGVCGLCVAAADRIYTVKELRALHNRCKCEVLPITSVADPGLDLNGDDLQSIYDEAGGTAAKQLTTLRFTVEQHGELGPLLVSPGGLAIPHFVPRSDGTSQAAA